MEYYRWDYIWWDPKLLSLITIIFLIPLLFYGYKHVFKKENTIFNISTFYISIAASQLLFKYILSLPQVSNTTRYLSCIGVFILFGCYMVLTLMPAKNAFFKDPITKKYGFKGHTDVDKEH